MNGFSNMFQSKTDTATVQHRPVGQHTLNGQMYEQAASQQVAISAGAGRALESLRRLKSEDVATYGANTGQELSKLAEEVTKKVSLAESGFGAGVVEILKLTSSVDINDLGDKKETGLVGFVSKIKNKITGHKIEFMSNFNSTSDEIEKIANNMRSGVTRMKGEAAWLEKCYDKNLEYLRELEINMEAIEVFVGEQQDVLAKMQGDTSIDPMVVSDQKVYVDRLERQMDKISRLMHMAKLTAPEIRLMQQTNYNNSEDFKDLIETTIPAWKKKISLAIISVRQKKDTEFSNMMKDKSNEFFKQAADLVHDNSIAAAQSRNKSSLEISTIEHIQNQQIDAVRQIKLIDEEGRRQRADAASRLKQMNTDLETEMRTW